jgi:hypothetical protein
VKPGLLASSLLIVSAPVVAQSTPATRKEIIYVEPTEGDYAAMILAATGWARANVAKSLGVVQQADATPAWKRGIEAAARQYGLKTIDVNDFTMVCFTRQSTRSTPASRVCSMKGADAILQFNTLRIAGDSGAMVLTTTRVPKNAARTETTHYCVVMARQEAGWVALRSDQVTDPDKCIQ